MRARNIKPGFFKNPVLAEIFPPWGRLLFAGLWCLGDREGRLKDRAAQIAVEIFPYDIANRRLSMQDVEKILSDLSQGEEPFITRYEVDGHNYIQIENFNKH